MSTVREFYNTGTTVLRPLLCVTSEQTTGASLHRYIKGGGKQCLRYPGPNLLRDL